MIDDVVFTIWLILLQCNNYFYSWFIYYNVSFTLFRAISVTWSRVVLTLLYYYRLGMICMISSTNYNLLNYIIKTLNLYFWCIDTNEFHYYDILITFYAYALIFIFLGMHNYLWAYSCGHRWNKWAPLMLFEIHDDWIRIEKHE